MLAAAPAVGSVLRLALLVILGDVVGVALGDVGGVALGVAWWLCGGCVVDVVVVFLV